MSKRAKKLDDGRILASLNAPTYPPDAGIATAAEKPWHEKPERTVQQKKACLIAAEAALTSAQADMRFEPWEALEKARSAIFARLGELEARGK